MPSLLPSNPRKRPRAEPVRLEETSHPPSKRQRQRLNCHRSQTSSAYWDNVSKVWLTKRALKELDRRTRKARPNPSPARQHTRRPVTRSCTAKLKKPRCRAEYTVNPVDSYELRVAKKIKLYARQGGPNLSELRSYPEHRCPTLLAMSSNRSSHRSRRLESGSTHNTVPTTATPRTKSTGPYDRQFEQILVDNNIYPHGYDYPDGSRSPKPDNWSSFNQMLAQPRPSLSPSKFGEEEFDNFAQADARAKKEWQVCESVIPYIEGNVGDSRCRSGGIPFANLDHVTDRTLTDGKPDVFYGARPEQLHREVREMVGHHIMPSTQEDLPLAPNFFLEVKGPEGSLAVANRQACYDGALGARGMHSLRTYGQSTPAYDNNAYTMSNIYHGGTLKMYTSHIGPPRTAGGRPETYMNQINTYGMTGNVEAFRTGATAYRNGRDWAKEQRDSAIMRANEWSDDAAAADESASPALSFVTAEETEESYTISQQSQPSLNEDTNASSEEDSDGSLEEPAELRLPAKRSTRSSTRPKSQRKRHMASTPQAGASTTTTPQAGASTTTTPQAGASTTTTPQAGASTTSTWVWDEGHRKYRYWNGREWIWQQA